MNTNIVATFMVFLLFVTFQSNAQTSSDFEDLINTLKDKNSSEILYSVQLGAFQKSHRKGYFDSVEHLFSRTYEDGFTRFFTGLFRSLTDAIEYRDAMRRNGFSDAFVLGMDGGFDRILIDVD